jgi:hypothetical protein
VHELIVLVLIDAQKPAIKRLSYQLDNHWHPSAATIRRRCGAFFAFEAHHLQ